MSPSKDTSNVPKKSTNQTSSKPEDLGMSYWKHRRRNSSECSTESHTYTGSRTISFVNKGEHVVHCGKCLGELDARVDNPTSGQF